MLNYFRHGCVLLLALPVVAMARPVTITSHSTGLITIDSQVMEALGAYNFQATGPLPYELTLTTSHDVYGSISDRGMFGSTGPIDVTIDFHVGDFDYHYAGQQMLSTRLSTLDAATDRVEHIIDLNRASAYYEYIEFTNAFSIPSDSMGGASLVPGHVEGSNPSGSSYATILYAVPMWYGDPIHASMNGTVSTYSLDVTSPVPEPATYAMLGAGLLAVGLRRRVGRTRSTTSG